MRRSPRGREAKLSRRSSASHSSNSAPAGRRVGPERVASGRPNTRERIEWIGAGSSGPWARAQPRDDLARLAARLPQGEGPLARRRVPLRPDSLLGAPGAITEPRRALLELLFMIGGRPQRLSDGRLRSSSPLHLVAWAKSAGRQILAAMAADIGALVADAPRDGTGRFRGSNEAGTSLALKALAATWAKRRAPKAPIRFEERKEEVAAEGSLESALCDAAAMHAMLGAARLRRTGSQPRALEWADTASDPAQGWPTTLSAGSLVPCCCGAADAQRGRGRSALNRRATRGSLACRCGPISCPAVSLAGIAVRTDARCLAATARIGGRCAPGSADASGMRLAEQSRAAQPGPAVRPDSTRSVGVPVRRQRSTPAGEAAPRQPTSDRPSPPVHGTAAHSLRRREP